MKSALGFFLPRRKEKLINALLACLIVGFFFILYQEIRESPPIDDAPFIRSSREIKFDLSKRTVHHEIPDYSKPRDGPGEDGKGVNLQGQEQIEGQSQMKTWFMNVIARFIKKSSKEIIF